MFRTSSRAGDVIYLIGLVGRNSDGEVVDGVKGQAVAALERAEQLLGEHGVDRRAIVRLRVFLIDMREWPEVLEVVTDFFDDEIPPAIAMSVTGLVEPAVRLELEIDASGQPT